MKAFLNNIEKLTLENDFYRRVLFTGKHEQLVVMSLLPGEDIGEEVHNIDQFFRFESGQGKVVLNGKEYKVEDGSGVIVPSGIKHNIVNISDSEPLKLYTIYSEPQHPEDAKFSTKEEAMKEEHIEKSWKEYKSKFPKKDGEKIMMDDDAVNDSVKHIGISSRKPKSEIKKETKVKMKDKTPAQSKKYDRCVEQVKEQGDDVNPYAVCQSSVLGNTSEVNKYSKIPMTPERARELHEKQKEYQLAHKKKKSEGKVDQTTERGKHQSEKRFNPGVQDGFAVKCMPKGWEGFEKGDIYDQHQDDEADEEMWEAKYNKYYGKDKKLKGENKMSEEPIEKAWKKFKKSYNGVAGYTQDEIDRMDAKEYARAKDKSLESAIPQSRELAEKKKKEAKKV